MAARATHPTNSEVFVFNETGISEVSRDGLVKSLTALLAPEYTIKDINQNGLQRGDWTGNCALLVLPHCTTVAPYRALAANAIAVQHIRQFVGEGGACLGICGGAYFASTRVDWQGQARENSSLALAPGTSRGPHLSGGPQTHELIIPFLATPRTPSETARVPNAPYCELFCDNGGEFEPMDSFHILAQYATSGVAAIQYAFVHGGVTLWHPHLEYSFLGGPAREAYELSHPRSVGDARIFRSLEIRRFVVIESTLNGLGVITPDIREGSTLSPLPQLLLVSPFHPQRSGIEENIRRRIGNPPHRIIGDREEFDIQPLSWVTRDNWNARGNRQRNTWVMSMGSVPPTQVTPFFNLAKYFAYLRDVRRQYSSTLPVGENLGDTILYGERVTSTQTQLSRNQRVLNILPSPLLSLATFQLDGVSRNQGRWFSPYGVLQWSLLLEIPRRLDRRSRQFTVDSITHLVGLTVVEVCRQFLPHDRRSELALKWPNDIYAIFEKDQIKIGGIVVDLFPLPGPEQKHRVLIGCGLNVHNCPPLSSLSQLVGQELSMERIAAELMAGLAHRWYDFVQGGGSFESFSERYQRVWLHPGHEGYIQTDQEVEECTLKKIDEAGQLVLQQSRRLGARTVQRELTVSLERYSFDISRILLYPTPTQMNF